MADAILNINESVLESVITRAIIDSITPEARDQMLAGAIDKLLEAPARGELGYNAYAARKTSNLELALERAIFTTAMKVASEQLDADPRLRQRIQEIIDPLILGLLEEDYADFIKEAIGKAIVEVLRDMRDNRS